MKQNISDEMLVRLFQVEIFSDVYEKAARSSLPYMGRLANRGVPAEARESNIIFVHVPKNAGTSINHCLYGRNIGHRSAEFYRATLGPHYDKALRFAVLRDPFERFASAAVMFLDDQNADIQVHPRIRKRFGKIRTLEDILDWAEDGVADPYRVDVIFRPQSWFLLSREGKLIVDNLFTLGVDDGALAEFILTHSGKSLLRKNKSASKSLDFTVAQRERLRHIYASDFGLIWRRTGTSDYYRFSPNGLLPEKCSSLLL